jgi:hypothetical protein
MQDVEIVVGTDRCEESSAAAVVEKRCSCKTMLVDPRVTTQNNQLIDGCSGQPHRCAEQRLARQQKAASQHSRRGT